MAAERITYWLNVGDYRRVHKSSCPNCFMTYRGHEKKDWGGQRKNWWGPYSTIGAAIDAGSLFGDVVDCENCRGSSEFKVSRVDD